MQYQIILLTLKIVKGGLSMRALILVSSPPACGKTFVSMALSKALKHVVYLDKDTLIPLSKQIFKVAGQPYNRSSRFFEENIRDYEYEVTLDLAMDALKYEDLCLISAPFTQEVRDPVFIASLRKRLAELNARLVVIWVNASIEVCHQRMINRASSRDVWKIEHWDEYIKTRDFTPPTDVIPDLIIFENSTDEEYLDSLAKTVKLLEEEE